VTGYIRFEQPGNHTIAFGVVQEGVGWLESNLARGSVAVLRSAASSYAAVPAAPRLFVPLATRGSNGWTTRLGLANASDQPASVVLTFFRPDGQVLGRGTLSLPPRGAALYDVAQAGLPMGFVGSALVQAPVPLALVAYQERPDWDRTAVEPLVSGSARLFAPLAAKNYHGLSTGLQVQNVGGAATTASITYVQADGATWSESLPLPPMGSGTFYTPASPSLPDGFIGSAVVESDGQPLVATVSETRTDRTAMAYAAQGTASAAGVAPLLFRNRGGWSSALQIQNVGAGATQALARFLEVDGEGGPWEQDGTVGFAISTTFYLPAHPEIPDGTVASADVRTRDGQHISVLAHSANADRHVGTAVGVTQEGADVLTVPWFVPASEGWRSGLQVQNRGGTASGVTLSFFDVRGARALLMEDVIPAAAARTYYGPDLSGLPAGFKGSVLIHGPAGASLSAVVNEVR
jgi:hypothetical protein